MEPTKNWTLGDSSLVPHRMGPRPVLEKALFPDNFNIRISYRTERDALIPLLPPGIEPAGDPIVHFAYRHSEKLDWVCSSELNVIGMCVDAVYRGERDQEAGAYWPALWENDPMAVILGRELFGVPKLCADVSNPIQGEHGCRALLSEAGRPLIEMRIRDLSPIEGEALAGVRGIAEKASVLGWKQFPTVNGRETELGYATHLPGPIRIEQAWIGSGDVRIFEPDPDVNMWNHSIIETLQALPLSECLGASLSRGSSEHQIGAARALR